MSSKDIMRDLQSIHNISDEVLNLKYSQFYINNPEAVGNDVLRYGYVLEDVKDIIPEAIVNYKSLPFPFVKSEVVMAVIIQKLCEKIKKLEEKVYNESL